MAVNSWTCFRYVEDWMPIKPVLLWLWSQSLDICGELLPVFERERGKQYSLSICGDIPVFVKKSACVILINQGCKQIIWLSYILPSQKGAATHTVYTRQTRPNWTPMFSFGYWTWTKISGRKHCRVKLFLQTKQKKGTHYLECPNQETQDNLHKNAWKASLENEKQTDVFYAKF